MTLHRARAVLLPQGLLRDGVVQVEDGVVVEVREAHAGDPPAHDGTIVPGLVNAHLHLELSWLAGRVPPASEGFHPWVRQMLGIRRAGPSEPEVPLRRAQAEARAMVQAGTVAVGDVTNERWTPEVLDAAGLRGVAFLEVLGFGRDGLIERIEGARAEARRVGGVVARPAPHAVYSTPGALIRAACGLRGGAPSCIHVAEDVAEEQFLSGDGPYPAFMDAAGIDWRWAELPRASPVAWLDALGVLGPDLLAVHGVHLSAADRALLAARGSALCLCPRSNLHIGGRLPDVPALLDAGVALCLGTDSLASCDSLDVLADVAVLRASFPSVDPTTWLQLATRGGAVALGLELGRIEVGRRPGLVLLEGVEGGDFVEAPSRRVLEAA